MKFIFQFIVIFIVVLLVSRHESAVDTPTILQKETYSKLKEINIEVRGLGDVSKSKLRQVSKTIEHFYGFTTKIEENVEICPDMYIENSTHILNASICLKDLNDLSKKVIWVTDKELWASGDMVNGLAYLGGNTVIVSATAKGLDETVKHELGHTFGLGHCSDLKCVMASDNDIHETGKFCESCKNYFIKIFNLK